MKKKFISINHYFDRNLEVQDYSNWLYSAANWALARVPNPKEVFHNSLFLGAIYAVFDDHIIKLGADPVAKAVVRDVAKIPGLFVSKYKAIEVGGTGVKYDEGHIWGHLAKTTCKGVIIGSAAYYANYHYRTGIINLEQRDAIIVKATTAANFPCESFERSTSTISNIKQKTNNTDTYYSFYRNHLDIRIATESLVSGCFKSFVTYLLVKDLKTYMPKILEGNNIFNVIKLPGHYLEEGFLRTLGYGGPALKYSTSTLREKIGIINNIDVIKILVLGKSSSIVALIFMDIVIKTTAEMVDTYILAPLSRVAKDSSLAIITSLQELYASGELSYQNLNIAMNIVIKTAAEMVNTYIFAPLSRVAKDNSLAIITSDSDQQNELKNSDQLLFEILKASEELSDQNLNIISHNELVNQIFVSDSNQ